MTKCRWQGLCKNEAYYRGLCRSCYGEAYKIQRGHSLTFSDFVKVDRMLPDETRSLFRGAYNRIKMGIDPTRFMGCVSIEDHKAKVPDQCLTPGCNDNATRRGVCATCFTDAESMCNSGETSLSELESLGLIDFEFDVPSGVSLFRFLVQELKAGRKIPMVRMRESEVSRMSMDVYQCHTPSCRRKVISRTRRALCEECFLEAVMVVSDGIATLTELEEIGILPIGKDNDQFERSAKTDKPVVRRGHALPVALAKFREDKMPLTASGESDTCLIPDCSNPTYMRGICNSCYRKAYILKRQRKLDFDELVAAGLMLPDQRERSQPVGP